MVDFSPEQRPEFSGLTPVEREKEIVVPSETTTPADLGSIALTPYPEADDEAELEEESFLEREPITLEIDIEGDLLSERFSQILSEPTPYMAPDGYLAKRASQTIATFRAFATKLVADLGLTDASTVVNGHLSPYTRPQYFQTDIPTIHKTLEALRANYLLSTQQGIEYTPVESEVAKWLFKVDLAPDQSPVPAYFVKDLPAVNILLKKEGVAFPVVILRILEKCRPALDIKDRPPVSQVALKKEESDDSPTAVNSETTQASLPRKWIPATEYLNRSTKRLDIYNFTATDKISKIIVRLRSLDRTALQKEKGRAVRSAQRFVKDLSPIPVPDLGQAQVEVLAEELFHLFVTAEKMRKGSSFIPETQYIEKVRLCIRGVSAEKMRGLGFVGTNARVIYKRMFRRLDEWGCSPEVMQNLLRAVLTNEQLRLYDSEKYTNTTPPNLGT